MDHSERRFGERNWSSQQDQEQSFVNFMRQNDPNRPRSTARSPATPRGVSSMRASDSTPRREVESPYASLSSSQRRNTYDPSFSNLRVPSSITQSPLSMSQTPNRRSPHNRPKAPPLADDDMDNLVLSDRDEDDDLDASIDDDDEQEISTDQKPAAKRMQQVPGGIEAPVVGGPFASMVRDSHREPTIGGVASSFPRSEDRWHSGGAPTRPISPHPDAANGSLPTAIAVPLPRPNYNPLEPAVPESRLGRRCLIHKPKREADLVKGLAVTGASGTVRSRDTIVVLCARCGSILSMPRNAIVVSCPSCYKISPAASCRQAEEYDDEY